MHEYKVNYIDEDIKLITNLCDLKELNDRTPDTYILISCQQGQIQFHFNGTLVTLSKQVNFVCVPNSRISQIMVSPDARLAILKISISMVQGLIHSHIEQWNQFFYVKQNNLLVADDKHQKQMQFYYDLIRSKTESDEQPYHKEIMQSIIKGVLLEILSLIKQSEQQGYKSKGVTGNRSKYHFTQFLRLLSATAVKHRPVEYYANQLCITPKYLSFICKECSNKSAREWNNDLKNEDIRYHLVNTDLSIKEIAQVLGFEDFSFFCKYVRRNLGCSPSEYRNRNRYVSHNNSMHNKDK